MKNQNICKVLVAPHIKIEELVPWSKMLDLIAEAINTARNDGSVQILQSISIEQEGEEEGQKINQEDPQTIVSEAYKKLVVLFDGHGPVVVKKVSCDEGGIYVITLEVRRSARD